MPSLPNHEPDATTALRPSRRGPPRPWLLLVAVSALLLPLSVAAACWLTKLGPPALAGFLLAEVSHRSEIAAISRSLDLSLYERVTLARIEQRYGQRIESLAKERGLPRTYFVSLIFLETRGLPSPRQEPTVFERLQQVRDGSRERLAYVEQAMILDASDEALMNLATSWGPFQILGWHCLEIGVLVADIRGEDTLEWGMTWIDKEYGHLLRRARFEDAFHYHNTGRLYPDSGPPLTHHLDYVPRGTNYMAAFEQLGPLYRPPAAER